MGIVKRKIKKKWYYYLKHSYRKNDKVITKEIYLGKEVPLHLKNMKKKLREPQKELLQTKLESIKNHFQKNWKRVPEKIKEKELHELALAFTYNTNAIEGSTITLEETRSIAEDHVAPAKKLNDIKETEKQYHLFLNMLKKKGKITNALILQWHKELFAETKPEVAGQYRDYLVRVGSYVAPDWQEVKKLMDECIRFIESNKHMHPVELAGRVHYQFEKIHPFGDGNGRIGRLLMNFMLWHAGYPMLIIEYTKRTSYYKAFQKGEDGFTQYFLRRYLAVHKNRIN